MKKEIQLKGKALIDQVRNLETKNSEKISLKDNTGKDIKMTLYRDGVTDKKIMTIFKDPHASADQKLGVVAEYLWQEGKESASFLAEMFRTKGQHTKETRAFKTEIRFDFEQLSNLLVLLFQDISNTIDKGFDVEVILQDISQHFKNAAEIVTKKQDEIIQHRLKEKGFGLYIDKKGEVYDTNTPDLVDIVKKDIEDTKTNE